MAQPAAPSFEEAYARIRALPAGTTGEILEPGVVRTMSRPGRAHARAAKRCLASLAGFDVESGGSGWWVLVEYEVAFPLGRLVVPDLAGWRVSRVPELPDETPLAIVPDWCCEVLSPTTESIDRTVKLPLHAASGVSWVWLVDPRNRTVEVFETVAGRATFTGALRDEGTAALPPFDAPVTLVGWWS